MHNSEKKTGKIYRIYNKVEKPKILTKLESLELDSILYTILLVSLYIIIIIFMGYNNNSAIPTVIELVVFRPDYSRQKECTYNLVVLTSCIITLWIPAMIVCAFESICLAIPSTLLLQWNYFKTALTTDSFQCYSRSAYKSRSCEMHSELLNGPQIS